MSRQLGSSSRWPQLYRRLLEQHLVYNNEMLIKSIAIGVISGSVSICGHFVLDGFCYDSAHTCLRVHSADRDVRSNEHNQATE